MSLAGESKIGGSLYHLSTEAVQGVRDAHEGGVRALAVLSEDLIVTGSDDKMVTLWKRMPGTAQFACRHICPEHQKSLRAILAIPAGKFSCIPSGGFATGDLDKVVRVYGVDLSSGQILGEGPVRTLLGHAGGVISLSFSARGELLSGGWDGQVRVWDVDNGKCLQTLEGHENGTCVLGLVNGDIAAGSTGRKNEFDQPADFKIRIWTPSTSTHGAGASRETGVKPMYVIKRVFEDHTLGVRDLAHFPDGSGFVSCSNDGSIRARKLDGSPLPSGTKITNPSSTTDEGHPVFCFSVHVSQTGLIATCNEDQTVRIYAPDGSHLDEIQLPGTPWKVDTLPSGDLVVGCDQAGYSGRGHLYVFTTSEDSSKSPNEDTLVRFKRDIVKPKRSEPTGEDNSAGDRIITSGPYSERQSRRGTKDGQNGFFIHPEGVMFCTWSAAAGIWTDVGIIQEGAGDGDDSMDGPGPVGGKKWDYTRGVTLDTPNGTRSLQLSWNEGDDVQSVAKNFLMKNSLAEDSYEEVRDFIFKIQASDGEAVRRRKAAESSSSSVSLGSGLIPSKSFIELSTIDFKKVIPKLIEVSGTLLSAEDIASLNAVVSILEQTSRFHATVIPRTGVHVLFKLISTMSSKDVFPAIDVLRVLIVHSDGAKAIAEIGGTSIVPTTLFRIIRDTATSLDSRASTLLAARTLFNAFRNEAGRNLLTPNAEAVSTLVEEGIVPTLAHEHATVRYAGAVLLHNLIHASHHFVSDAVKKSNGQVTSDSVLEAVIPVKRVFGLIKDALATGKEDDFKAVLLTALGTAARLSPEASKSTEGLKTVVEALCQQQANSALLKDVIKLL